MFRRIHAPTTLNSALLQRVLPVWNARATRSEWIYQALDMLNGLDGLDRMAVWIASDFSVEGHDSPLVFQGKVLEADGGEGPEEWTRISGNAPLPVELLNRGLTVEYKLPESGDDPCWVFFSGCSVRSGSP